MRRTLPSLVLLLAASSGLSAATWTGGGDGVSWADPANWSDNAPPSADDTVWNIGEGFAVVLDGPAPGDRVIKSGSGTLLWGETASASVVEVSQGTFDFAGARLQSEVHLSGGTVSGYILDAPIHATGGTLSAVALAPLTMTGGPVLCVDVFASYSINLSAATVQGRLVAQGAVGLIPGASSSIIEGALEMTGNASLCWSMQDSLLVAPLIVTGSLFSDHEAWIYFGLVDWSQPHWDTPHDVLFVDAWEGGIVAATFIPDPYAGNESEGSWSQVPTADGDVILRWTPLLTTQLQSAPIPEASAAPWAMALATAMLAARLKAGRRGDRAGQPVAQT